MSITLNKDLAYAICTVVATGFIEQETTETGNKTQFIYEKETDKGEHDIIQEYLNSLGINVKFNKQKPKVEHPLVIAMTKNITKDTEECIQDTQVYKAIVTDLDCNLVKKENFYGAYIGGCIKPNNSITFSGSSGLKLYDRQKNNQKWEIVIDNAEVEKSFNNAKETTDKINEYLESCISRHNTKNPKYFYCKDISSTTPQLFKENSLFGSIHGLVRVIIDYNLNEDGIGIGKDETCCELALSNDTCKVGSCIPCSIFASSNKTPANYTHLGRGDNWNFPDKKQLYSMKVLEDKKKNWTQYVKDCFTKGYKKLEKQVSPSAIGELAQILSFDDENLGEIFLHSLTFEGKFIDKMMYTLGL